MQSPSQQSALRSNANEAVQAAPHSTNQPSPASSADGSDFAQQAEQARPSLVTEFWLYLIQNKKWWLTPIILVLLLLGLLVVLGSTSAAPFIYTLF
jgi:hypothetical protein